MLSLAIAAAATTAVAAATAEAAATVEAAATAVAAAADVAAAVAVAATNSVEADSSMISAAKATNSTATTSAEEVSAIAADEATGSVTSSSATKTGAIPTPAIHAAAVAATFNSVAVIASTGHLNAAHDLHGAVVSLDLVVCPDEMNRAACQEGVAIFDLGEVAEEIFTTFIRLDEAITFRGPTLHCALAPTGRWKPYCPAATTSSSAWDSAPAREKPVVTGIPTSHVKCLLSSLAFVDPLLKLDSSALLEHVAVCNGRAVAEEFLAPVVGLNEAIAIVAPTGHNSGHTSRLGRGLLVWHHRAAMIQAATDGVLLPCSLCTHRLQIAGLT